jgi:hypothetical protein
MWTMPASSLRPAAVIAAVLLGPLSLDSCGGGDGSGGSPPPGAPAYAAPPILVVNTAMAPLSPGASAGTMSYTVSPALPPGLSINASTGVISGTPTQATGSNDYEVTATNGSGVAHGTLWIQVVGSLYPSSLYTFTAGVTSQTVSPTVRNVATATWSVAPPLPAGLTLNSSNGTITGTPIAATPQSAYVFSTTAAGGESTQSIALQVAAAPLLDLGHASAVNFARLSGTSLLTADATGHWVLWDYTTAQNVVNGTAVNSTGEFPQPFPVDLEGTTVVIQTSTGLQVRSAATGAVLGEITGSLSWWKLASDGSYICAGNSTSLTAWSPAGVVLFTRAGNYANAIAFAAPGQVQVALGAAGASVIETVTVAGGTSSVGPAFNGQFQSWFIDGGRFLTALSSTVWVYSSASVQQDLASLPTSSGLSGVGNWYWTLTPSPGSTLTLYAVGSAGTSTATYPLGFYGVAMPAGAAVPVVGLLTQTSAGVTQATVLNLSGATPVATTTMTPVLPLLNAFAASSATTWVVANRDGVVYDGTSPPNQPRYFGYGAATAIAGGTSNAVIATASGRILYYDSGTLALQGTINQLAWQLAESADGTVLVVATGSNDYATPPLPLSLSTYAMPAGTVTNTLSTPGLTLMDISAGGTVLGESFYSASPCYAQAIAISGGTTLWCDSSTAAALPALSPDGTLVASGTPPPNDLSETLPTWNIYQSGTLVGAVPGAAVAWLDNNTLLVNTYAVNSNPMEEGLMFTGANLYSATGTLISSTPLPATGPVQVVSSTSLYNGPTNSIYSLTSGAETWASGSPFTQDIVQSPNGTPGSELAGAVAGSYVIFESGNLILAEPY